MLFNHETEEHRLGHDIIFTHIGANGAPFSLAVGMTYDFTKEGEVKGAPSKGELKMLD